MRFRRKVAVMVVAVLLTLVGFNLLISSSALELARIGKQAGQEIIANYLARVEATTAKTPAIKG